MTHPTQISLRLTQMVTETRYIGAVCLKHPEQAGLRRIRNHECIGCIKARNKIKRKTPEALAKKYQTRKDQREMGKVASLMATQKADAIRIKACEIASSRVQNVARWQEFVNEAREALQSPS